jgi:putative sigma-54 modulation protein
MEIQIQSLHFEAGQNLTNKVTQKLSSLELLYDRIERCTVVLKHEKNDQDGGFTIEVHLAVPKQDLFCKESAESFDIALDRVNHDLKKQLIRHKEKLNEQDNSREKISEEELSSE